MQLEIRPQVYIQQIERVIIRLNVRLTPPRLQTKVNGGQPNWSVTQGERATERVFISLRKPGQGKPGIALKTSVLVAGLGAQGNFGSRLPDPTQTDSGADLIAGIDIIRIPQFTVNRPRKQSFSRREIIYG